MPKGSRPLGAISSFLASGTYQRSINLVSAQAWVAGTEFEDTVLATNVVADDSQDAMYSWVRYQFALGMESENQLYELMVIRCKATEGIQDLNTSATIEELMKQGRVLKHILLSSGADGYGTWKWHKVELYNVKLPDGEELRAVFRPIKCGLANTGTLATVLEWREVGR